MIRLCRVIVKNTGELAIIFPSVKYRGIFEGTFLSDELNHQVQVAFFDQELEKTLQTTPELKDCPFYDVEQADLPDPTVTVRSNWRWVAGKVVEVEPREDAGGAESRAEARARSRRPN